MTEQNLYKKTCVVLALTLAAPAVVGLFGIGADDDMTPAKAVSSYAKNIDHPAASTPGDDKKASGDENKSSEKDDAISKKSEASKNDASKERSTTPEKTTKKDAGTYTVKAGDTYGCIAESHYGSYEMWPAVQRANAGPGYGEYTLHVGAKLTLPATTTELETTNLCD